MIERAKGIHTKQLQELWNQCFPQESVNYTEFFFKHKYCPENTLVIAENGKVQASLQRYPHEIMMNDRILKTSMIVGVLTHPDFRMQGKMKELMKESLDHAEHQELVTLIQSYDASLYEDYGFEMVYYHKEFKIHRDQIKRLSNKGCSYDVDSEEMLKLYATFVKHFNGFYIRDVAYFDLLKEEVDAQNGKIIAYYNEEGVLEAYGTLLPKNQEVVLEECIYMNSVALMKLVNLALQHRAWVTLYTSNAENLNVLFPKAEVNEVGFMMAKVNDFDLFNRLYGTDVSTTKEAFEVSGKSLYINEFM